MNKVLVAYGSKYGATAEIAAKIGEVLTQAGLPAEVLPANRVGDLDVYDAIVLGGAVYIGRWHKHAASFLTKNEQALVGRPVWLFSSGPTGEGDPAELVEGWRFPGNLQPIADRIKPRDVTLFHGAADPAKLNLLHKRMLRMVGAPTGDFRDWDAISAWAAGIAAALKGAGSGSAVNQETGRPQ